MSTVHVSDNLTVTGSVAIVVDNMNGYTGYIFDNSATLTNKGSIQITSPGGASSMHGMYAFYKNVAFTNTAAATFAVIDTDVNSNAYGFYGDVTMFNFKNAGHFSVQSSFNAVGITANPVTSSAFVVSNTGAFDVSGTNKAVGLDLTNGGTISNTGTVTVKGGAAGATGIYARGYDVTITNKGSLKVTDKVAPDSAIGIALHSDGPAKITNSGEIVARTAIVEDDAVSCAIKNSGHITGDLILVNATLSNTGTIAGDLLLNNSRVSNSGIITGDLSAGQVTNSGTITGDLSVGQLTNSGTITGDVVLPAGGSYTAKADGAVLHGAVYGGAIADSMTGGSGIDRFYGNDGNDTLRGNGGKDTLIGGAGQDTMYGGTEPDKFVFLALSDSTVAASDRIRDFSDADHDRINLSAIDAIDGGSDDAFSLVKAFTGVAGQLVAQQSSANVYLVQGDTNGDGHADFAISVTSDIKLVHHDFIL